MAETETTDRVLIEILVAAPVDTVWAALRDPAEIRRWFGWEYAGFDDEIEWIVKNGQKAVEAERVIYVQGMSDRFTLEPRGEHTLLRIIRAAPAATAGASGWQGIYDDTIEGWTSFAHQLRLMLERHRGEDRRTLYFSGRSREAGTPAPPEAAGLGAIASLPAGARYALTLATGEAIAGEIWYRSEYQIGLTVDRYGDGLLVLARRPTTEKSLHGGGTALLSTYGLSDEALAHLRAVWTAWWQANYEIIEIQPELRKA